jgi:restriction system protein
MTRRRRYASKSSDSSIAIVVVCLVSAGSYFITIGQTASAVLCFLLLLAAIGLFAYPIILAHLRRRRLSMAGMDEIDRMDGLVFEQYLQTLLMKLGFTAVSITERFDKGIDLIAHKDGETWGVQAKRYTGDVGMDAIRQAVTAREYYKCTKVMAITNSYFTKSAKMIAESSGCTLIDRTALIQLIL